MLNVQAHSFSLPSQCTEGSLLCCCSLASQLLRYSQELTKCSCAANAHPLHSKTSSPSLDICFLALVLVSVIYSIMAWVKWKRPSDQILNSRAKQQWVLESWLQQEIIQFLLFQTLVAVLLQAEQSYAPPLSPSKYWKVAITGRGSSHTQVICLSVVMREKIRQRWKMQRIPHTHSLACHFPSFPPLKLDLFWGPSDVEAQLEGCV